MEPPIEASSEIRTTYDAPIQIAIARTAPGTLRRHGLRCGVETWYIEASSATLKTISVGQ